MLPQHASHNVMVQLMICLKEQPALMMVKLKLQFIEEFIQMIYKELLNLVMKKKIIFSVKIIELRQDIIHKLLFFDQQQNSSFASKVQLFLDFQPIKIFAIYSQDQFAQNLYFDLFNSILSSIKFSNPNGNTFFKFY
ncbi:unnamed protein product [Paramecium sonneborni]|uniref:Uncharacterized protein n=1 Tax=Paramecium sonneborni TaxID=65129 RepID=A0A8S1L4J0_9CILI|nr:unnamed protein product [Paramecium sonneborni]